MSDDAVIVYTTKELLEKIDHKLDGITDKLDSKADTSRVESLIALLDSKFSSEIARVDAILAPLVNPQTGIYSLIDASSRKLDGKTIGSLGAIVVLLAGVLFKKYLGLN